MANSTVMHGKKPKMCPFPDSPLAHVKNKFSQLPMAHEV